MNRFNADVTEMLLNKFENLTFEHNIGCFLADKSYAFDTIFLAARFIARFRFGDMYRKLELQDKSNLYFKDLFCLNDAAQVPNYMTESIALFRFTGIIEKTEKRGVYRIVDDELLDFVSSSFENAYIFLYMLCYCMFRNDGIWQDYVEFCKAKTLEAKQSYYDTIRTYIATHDPRVKDPQKLWAVFIPKYPMVVLNYANRENMIARTGRVKKETVSRKDISLNVKGTRANFDLPKKNAYLDDLSDSYIIETIRPYLAVNREHFDTVNYTESFSVDVADTKLDMLDTTSSTTSAKRKIQQSKYRQTGSGTVRTVQGEFRNGLFAKVPHKCPICGFHFERFLIASHIKPYAKCDDTYDAMNPNNGLLMCPICDKLFESANYITIDSHTGRIIYDTALETEPDFEYIKGDKNIHIDYIDCERKHYLNWHNQEFFNKHPTHPSASTDREDI